MRLASPTTRHHAPYGTDGHRKLSPQRNYPRAGIRSLEGQWKGPTMARTERLSRGTGDRMALGAITLLVLGATILMGRTADFPLIDDWTYAWSVEHFLQTGELRLLEWSAHYPLAQILWGTLFGGMFGFSFGVLRVSTLVLAWVGLLAFFRTLRTLGVDPCWSFLGTLTLWFNPVAFVLTHSFMTDVPFVSVTNGAILFYVRWVTRRRCRDLCVGSVLATVAFLIRQLGAGLALVPLVSLLVARICRGEGRPPPWPQILCLVFPFLGIGLTLWWITAVHGATRVYLEKVNSLHYIPAISGWVYFNELVRTLVHLGLVLGPLTIGTLGRTSKGTLGWAAGVVVVAIGIYLWQGQELPTPLGVILSADELGLSRSLIAGQVESRQLPLWSQAALLGVSLVSATAIVAALGDGIRRWSHWVNGPGTVLLTHSILQFVLMEVLWLYYDRYYLPLLPALVALLVGRMRPTRSMHAISLAGVLLFGAIAISGTMDNFRFNTAVSQAREWLLRQGVAPWHIDAGYALNGWWLYAHAPNGPPRRGREPDVPWITSSTPLPYKIASSVEPSYVVVRSFRWRALWAVSDTLYVLEHAEVTSHWGLPSMLAGKGAEGFP